MKDTINRLARGVFEYEPPRLKVEEQNIENSIKPNSITNGSFQLASESGTVIKGRVTTDNMAVTIINPMFAGVDNKIEYRINSQGFEDGHKIQGVFSIISNAGELSITYCFKIAKYSANTSMGELNNLFHFTNLFQKQPREAGKLFLSKEFPQIFLKDDYELKNRYYLMLKGKGLTGLADNRAVNECIEDFLISIHKKNSLQFELEYTQKEYRELSQIIKDTLVITKNTWGVFGLDIISDNPCIVPSVQQITHEHFTGNRYELEFLVDATKLHYGKNYVRLTVAYMNKKQYVDFVIHNYIKDEARANRLAIKRYNIDLVNGYVDFRLKKINFSQWLKQSLMAIENIRAIDDLSYYYKLIHCQLLISAKKYDEAKWLLDNVYEYIEPRQGEEPVLYGYYLYVSSLYNKDAQYSKKALETVKELYANGVNDWRVLWLLFYLDDEYEKNKSLKLEKIKEQFDRGCYSPIMYIEAVLAYNLTPGLIKTIDKFTIHTLLFACKYNLIDNKLLLHIIGLCSGQRVDDRLYLKLLVSLYNIYNDKELLSLIYRFISGISYNFEDRFRWIKAAVDNGLKITNIYENYLLYHDKKVMEPLPKVLLMYFTYNSSLDIESKEYLYANVYMNRYNDSKTFENFRPQIERFIIEQLERGRINNSLAILYQGFLEKSMITKDNCKNVANILFSYRLECKNPDIVKVLVKHKETDELQIRKVVDGSAFVTLYTSGYSIVFIDKSGRYIANEKLYTLTKVIEDFGLIPEVYRYNGDDMWISMHICEDAVNYSISDERLVNIYMLLALKEGINPSLRIEYMEKIVDYFYNSYTDNNLLEDFRGVAIEAISPEYKNKIVDIYISHGLYEEAVKLLPQINIDSIGAKKLLRLCASMINIVDNEFDSQILAICHCVFNKGKYNELLLKYLVKYYEGSTSDMVELWKAAKDFEIDTYELEERIIGQILFARGYSSYMPKIFESYYNNGGKKRVIEGYIAYNSYYYFVKEEDCDTAVFNIIENIYDSDVTAITVCKLALLKYYSELVEKNTISQDRIVRAGKLMSGLLERGMIFEFFKCFEKVMDMPHSVMDKTIIEYRTNPANSVELHYILDDGNGKADYMIEPMKDMYEGIFVKSIVLFFGESLQYYIQENTKNTSEVIISKNLRNEELKDQEACGRFEMINEMINCIFLDDSKTLRKLMNVYKMADLITQDIFKPL